MCLPPDVYVYENASRRVIREKKKEKRKKEKKNKERGGGTSFRFERIRKNQGENRDGQVTDNVALDR